MPKASCAAASGRRRSTKKAWLNQSIEPFSCRRRQRHPRAVQGATATVASGHLTYGAGHNRPRLSPKRRVGPWDAWLPGLLLP